jgi:hypothetical protein
LAVFCRRSLSLVADEDACSSFDDVVGNGFELVDFQDAGDLWEESLQEPEIAAGDAFDRGDCLGVGEVLGVEGPAQAFPVLVENEVEFLSAEGAVAVGEPEAAVELRVVPESLVDSTSYAENLTWE